MKAELVRLGGSMLELNDVIKGLRQNHPHHTKLVVDELLASRKATMDGLACMQLIPLAFRDQILGYLEARTFEGRPELANEAWNDALYRVYERIESYDSSRSKLRTWIFNQARWAALAVLRRELRARLVPTEDLADELADTEERTSVGVEEEVAEKPTKRELGALRRAHRRLTETQQVLLELRFLEDCPYEVIARDKLLAGIPVEHLPVYANRAKDKLARFFAEEMGLPGRL